MAGRGKFEVSVDGGTGQVAEAWKRSQAPYALAWNVPCLRRLGLRATQPIAPPAPTRLLPTPRYFVVVAHWFVGDRHLIIDPNAVAISFPKVLAWTDGGTTLATLVTVEQSMLAVNDDVYRG